MLRLSFTKSDDHFLLQKIFLETSTILTSFFFAIFELFLITLEETTEIRGKRKNLSIRVPTRNNLTICYRDETHVKTVQAFFPHNEMFANKIIFFR